MQSNHDMQVHINTRQQQLNDQADQWRLANQESPRPAAPNNHSAPYAPALVRVGEALIGIGQQLKARYGEAMEQLPTPVIEQQRETAC